MPFVYKSIDADQNTSETWGVDLCFLRDLILRIWMSAGQVVGELGQDPNPSLGAFSSSKVRLKRWSRGDLSEVYFSL